MSTVATIYDSLKTQQCGALRYVDATHLSYLPYGGGDQLKINGIWQTIPTTGVVGLTNTGVFVNGVAGQNLANTTVYYVYAFMNGAVMTADYSTTTHAASATPGNAGTEIKSGDDSRTLLGMIYHNAGFIDALNNRMVRSYYNRNVQRRDFGAVFNAQIGLSALSFIELQTVIRCYFLNWANENVTAHYVSGGSHAAVNYIFLAIAWDGVMPVEQSKRFFNIDYYPGNYDNFCVSASNAALPEGAVHYATLMGCVDTNSVTVGAGGVFGVISGALRD